MKKILIIGATSAIAEATARLYAEQGDRLHLVARDGDKLGAIAADLRVRGADQVSQSLLDVTDYARHEAVVDESWGVLEGCDLVLIAHGALPDQAASEADLDRTLDALHINGLSVISLLTLLANRFEAQGRGTIAVIGSVAADRIRRGNYTYGTAKLAVTGFLEGLRLRLGPAGVNVLTIKPGFVDTPMTADFPKGALWAKPADVAEGIVNAVEKGKANVYLPWFWWGIMFIIRWLPGPIFRRLKI